MVVDDSRRDVLSAAVDDQRVRGRIYGSADSDDSPVLHQDGAVSDKRTGCREQIHIANHRGA